MIIKKLEEEIIMKLRLWLKKGKLAALFFILAMIITGCSSGNADSITDTGNGDKSTDGNLKTIKIACPAQSGMLSENALLAQRLGYIDEELEKAGYQAEFVGFAQAGPAINEAFAAGEIEYAFYNELPAMTAKSNGVDLKIIAATTQQNHYALFVTKKSGISSIKDLEGKKAIVIPGTILYRYFIDICKKNDIDSSKVEQINALADANSILISGEADAFFGAYSQALLLQSQGIGSILTNTTEDLEETSGLTLTGRTAFLESDPESAKAIIRALKRASEYAAENPDDVYGLLATDSSPEELLKQLYSYDTSFSYFNPALSDEYRKSVQSQYEFAKENQMLAGEINIDELLDSAYVDEILAE